MIDRELFFSYLSKVMPDASDPPFYVPSIDQEKLLASPDFEQDIIAMVKRVGGTYKTFQYTQLAMISLIKAVNETNYRSQVVIWFYHQVLFAAVEQRTIEDIERDYETIKGERGALVKFAAMISALIGSTSQVGSALANMANLSRITYDAPSDAFTSPIYETFTLSSIEVLYYNGKCETVDELEKVLTRTANSNAKLRYRSLICAEIIQSELIERRKQYCNSGKLRNYNELPPKDKDNYNDYKGKLSLELTVEMTTELIRVTNERLVKITELGLNTLALLANTASVRDIKHGILSASKYVSGQRERVEAFFALTDIVAQGSPSAHKLSIEVASVMDNYRLPDDDWNLSIAVYILLERVYNDPKLDCDMDAIRSLHFDVLEMVSSLDLDTSEEMERQVTEYVIRSLEEANKL